MEIMSGNIKRIIERGQYFLKLGFVPSVYISEVVSDRENEDNKRTPRRSRCVGESSGYSLSAFILQRSPGK